MTSRSSDNAGGPAAPCRLPGHGGPCGPVVHSFELEGVDELTARVFRAYRRSLRLHRQLMAKTMAEHGSHPGQAVCLRLLHANDGITQRDLTEALHVGRATVSKMLRGMEQTGLIERRPDDKDQRLVRVFLTASGRERAAALRGVEAAQINAVVGGLPQHDQEDLARLLDALSDSIERILDERRESGAQSPSGGAA